MPPATGNSFALGCVPRLGNGVFFACETWGVVQDVSLSEEDLPTKLKSRFGVMNQHLGCNLSGQIKTRPHTTDFPQMVV